MRNPIDLLWASVAAFLVLITPFVIYVEQQEYGIARPEIMLAMLAMALIAIAVGIATAWSPLFAVVMLAALLTFFADIQLATPGLKRLALLFVALCALLWVLRRHASSLVSVMMVTTLALTVTTPRSEAVEGEATPPVRRELPLIVHLVLDEHIGPDGVPSDAVPAGFAQRMHSFFIERGFHLFGSAYSQHDSTLPSLGHLLNLAPALMQEEAAVPGPVEGTYQLRRNQYFERLVEKGYTIRVHQPGYLDVCPSGLARTDCRTYAARTLRVLDDLDIPAHERVRVIAGAYLQLSEAYTRTKQRYQILWRDVADTLTLPRWGWERGTAPALGTMRMFDRLASELSAAQPGTMIFAHLLMPHYPYVYDEACVARPPSQWQYPGSRSLGGRPVNTKDSRTERYARYTQQVTCLQRKLASVLDAIPSALRDEAIVLIHGDHGPRISIIAPEIRSRTTATPSDYADHYSTLFAIRAPRLAPGSDTRAAPITCLLRTLVASGFRSTEGTINCSSSRVVFLRGSGQYLQHPLPDFPGGTKQVDR